MSWTSIFGEEINTKNGMVNTAEALKNKKRVAIYFSAHWCPPCRQFTPILGQFYEDAKAVDADGLEIIFVSADSDARQYNEYFGTMPFCSTEYGADVNEDLNGKFDVSGIPMFIVLDGNDGSVKDKEARGTVMQARGDVAACFAKW